MTHPPKETREAPLNPDVAARIADEALALQIGTTTRPAIEHQAALLTEQIEAFFAAGLPDDPVEAAQQREEIWALLAAAPTRQDPTFSTHTHMRALGRVLRRHVSQYRANQEGEEGEAPALLPWLDSEPLSEMYRVPTGLPEPPARRWLRLTTHGSLW
ncbi:hypothetical protein OG204_18805 [Streptomyces sp. NBC_01387]|uniref:hypothetical protein n=1 Tax=unclassified Streptomyces TaxID=2593676 RepID=UPI0022558D0F|nr:MULTISPECIES: hypothetical protein [unclassified Streptomyces]MCX4549595.1 hypothetical protein [Streptomyces sp. NBC_01500]WSC21128.1 hypothetical protein OIE60_16360 [Streptomyces sp. NBC_01766]